MLSRLPMLIAAVVFSAPVIVRAAEPPLKVCTDAARVTISAGERPILVYKYADVPYKPYVEKLFTPAGVNILRDSPHDHQHHHGLMFAVAVDGVNFWEESPSAGRQEHRHLEVLVQPQGELQSGGLTESLAWVAGQRQWVLFESRMLRAYAAEDLNATLVTWVSRLALAPRPWQDPPNDAPRELALTGSPYFGLGMRFLESMDKGGRFVNADGKTGVQGTNAAASRWCAYTARADGKPVTVAILSQPQNPRPATWFTMDTPFAYLSATLGLDKEPLKITHETDTRALQYGVAVWDGAVDASQIQNLYERWLTWLSQVKQPASQPAQQP